MWTRSCHCCIICSGSSSTMTWCRDARRMRQLSRILVDMMMTLPFASPQMHTCWFTFENLMSVSRYIFSVVIPSLTCSIICWTYSTLLFRGYGWKHCRSKSLGISMCEKGYAICHCCITQLQIAGCWLVWLPVSLNSWLYVAKRVMLYFLASWAVIWVLIPEWFVKIVLKDKK